VTAPGRWRERTFASLRKPQFRTYYIGLLCNMSGFWMRIAATSWFVYGETKSLADLGIITAAGLLPWVPISPWAGVIAERTDLRVLLVRIYVGTCFLNAALGVAMLFDLVGWTEILVATILTGCLRGMENPPRHALLRRLVGVESIGNAIGLSATAFHLMHAIGFALAGAVYAFLGAGACFIAVALATAVMAVQVLRLKADTAPLSDSRRNPAAELAEGFRYVWRQHLMRTLIFGSAGVVFLLLSFRALMPAISKDVLMLGPLGYGLLMSLGGAGALAAALWVASGSGGRGRRVRNLFGTVWVACFAVLVVAWARSLWLCAPAVLVAGFCQVGFMAGANTTVQEAVPDELRARVMGIWSLMFGAALPLGTALIGWGAEVFSTSAAITVGASTALLISLALYRSSAGRLTVAIRDEVRESEEQFG
jgi:MFS family permease